MSVVEVQHVRHHPEEPRRVGHRGLEIVSGYAGLRVTAQLVSEFQEDLDRAGFPSPDRHSKGIEDMPPVLAQHALRDGLVWIAGYERGQFLGRQSVVLAHRCNPPFTPNVCPVTKAASSETR